MNIFQKSDIGAQAAWKGFSSQTLYIASRLISDEGDNEYYPEDVEDLVIKKDGIVIEAVQVKNISADLTLSSLASTKTSKGGEGFFNRMCSLHTRNPSFHCIKVVYFNGLGIELQEVQEGKVATKRILRKRLIEKHGLSELEAIWLIDSLYFEKVNLDDLNLNIQTQISNYVPVMSAPRLAKDLLIQHISVLSKSSIVENPRLAMYNLYSAAKALADFQKEYDLLFSDYSSLNEDFAKQELENVLTLVNVWRYVLDNQPKGYAIAYDAKQKYCKGTKYFYDTLSKAVMAVGGTLLKGNKYAYIIVEYNMEEDNDFKNEYTKIVMAIREVFKNSVLPSSDRWYLETQSLELAYVPVFSGVFSPIVYSIPFYKLLDTEESNIAKTMYPCEIEPILSEKINATEILQLWVDAMKKIGEIKLYLKRYQQIIQVPVDEKCLCSMTSYIKLLMEQINVLWEEFLLLEDTVSVMIEDADEQSSKQLNFVQHFFDCYEKIEAVISSKNDSTELIQVIEMVYIVMFALLPFVSKYDLQHKNI